jgi:hypothetical protein
MAERSPTAILDTMRAVLSSLIAFALVGVAASFAGVDPGGQEGANIPTSGSAPDNEAAARHARRTACLKEAKARKLVGPARDAFVKDCLGGS